jgi:hypothetical protein
VTGATDHHTLGERTVPPPPTPAMGCNPFGVNTDLISLLCIPFLTDG